MFGKVYSSDFGRCTLVFPKCLQVQMDKTASGVFSKFHKPENNISELGIYVHTMSVRAV